MVENNSTNDNDNDLSVWQAFLQRVKNVMKSIQKHSRKFNKKYPDIAQVIQLTFIYFFAVIDLIYGVLSNVYAFGYYPELLSPFYPIIKAVLMSPILRIWASPEKVFFMSYVVIEFMVVRSVFKFSKLVRYNILLIFALLMIQGLTIAYWDVIFNRQVASLVGKWAWDGGAVIYSDKVIAIRFFLNTFMVYFLLYVYLYIRAVSGKFATIPTMEWLTDSVAFWLRIKTPTMPYGKRKKKKKNDDKDKES